MYYALYIILLESLYVHLISMLSDACNCRRIAHSNIRFSCRSDMFIGLNLIFIGFNRQLNVSGFLLFSIDSVLRQYNASKLLTFSFLLSISGVLFSSLLLGDELTRNVLIGTGLVAAGIYLANKQK